MPYTGFFGPEISANKKPETGDRKPENGDRRLETGNREMENLATDIRRFYR